MTPLQRACLEMGSYDDPNDMKMTASVVSAYLTALSEDAGTVEKVARSIYLAMYAKDGGRWEANETPEVWHEFARAALNVLAGKEPT